MGWSQPAPIANRNGRGARRLSGRTVSCYDTQSAVDGLLLQDASWSTDSRNCPLPFQPANARKRSSLTLCSVKTSASRGRRARRKQGARRGGRYPLRRLGIQHQCRKLNLPVDIESSREVLDHRICPSQRRLSHCAVNSVPVGTAASAGRELNRTAVSGAARPIRGNPSGVVSSFHPRSRVQSVPQGTCV